MPCRVNIDAWPADYFAPMAARHFAADILRASILQSYPNDFINFARFSTRAARLSLAAGVADFISGARDAAAELD